MSRRSRSGPEYPPSDFVYPSTTKPGFNFIDFWITKEGSDLDRIGHGLTPGTAFATLQAAVDHVGKSYVWPKVQPYIKYKPGTYEHRLELADALMGTTEQGGGPIVVQGTAPNGGFFDTIGAAIDDVMIDFPHTAMFSILLAGSVVIHCMKLRGGSVHPLVYATFGGSIETGDLHYADGSIKEYAHNDGRIVSTGGKTISHGGVAFRKAERGKIFVAPAANTFVNSPSFSEGILSVEGRTGSIVQPYTTSFSGAVTGKKARLYKGGEIETNDGGASLPGSAAIDNDATYPGYLY